VFAALHAVTHAVLTVQNLTYMTAETHVQGVRLNHTIFAREERSAMLGDCTPL
jgi:hypothetical protein